jgi:hypothetical protein
MSQDSNQYWRDAGRTGQESAVSAANAGQYESYRSGQWTSDLHLGTNKTGHFPENDRSRTGADTAGAGGAGIVVVALIAPMFAPFVWLGSSFWDSFSIDGGSAVPRWIALGIVVLLGIMWLALLRRARPRLLTPVIVATYLATTYAGAGLYFFGNSPWNIVVAALFGWGGWFVGKMFNQPRLAGPSVSAAELPWTALLIVRNLLLVFFSVAVLIITIALYAKKDNLYGLALNAFQHKVSYVSWKFHNVIHGTDPERLVEGTALQFMERLPSAFEQAAGRLNVRDDYSNEMDIIKQYVEKCTTAAKSKDSFSCLALSKNVSSAKRWSDPNIRKIWLCSGRWPGDEFKIVVYFSTLPTEPQRKGQLSDLCNETSFLFDQYGIIAGKISMLAE